MERQEATQRNIQEKSKLKGRTLFIILAVLGAVIMGYLISLHYTNQANSICEFGEKLSCDLVNKSHYSEILGIPFSVLGFVYFLGTLGAGIGWYNRFTLKKVIFFSILFLGPALYLTGTEIFLIKSFCLFCEISKILMISIVINSYLALKPEKFDHKELVVGMVIAIFLGGATYLLHSITLLN